MKNMYSTKLKFLKLIVVFFTVIISIKMNAQSDMKIGNNPGTKTSSAVLEVESTTKGFLMPRMDETQMKELKEPTEGLLIYNLDQSCIYIYRGSEWYRQPLLSKGVTTLIFQVEMLPLVQPRRQILLCT